MTNIMVATDGSDGARRAIDVAAKLAKALACNLLIVTVADRLLEEEARRLPHNGATAGDLLEALTGQTLKAAEARACEIGPPRIEVRTCWGDVTQSLIDLAAQTSSTMIVVGRRGRGQLTGLLLGSVSQKLVSLAPCAVVVVP
ncbi:universal stress protein [Bradyrhizobium sp. WBOS7]|uniref:Universal stress protein n=1 Tax=Bradyrhizobium betae TaxID=244734 RepID=A0AAE9NBB4_9BRAD|nr:MULTISPECIES: universal stress protein [Bradyrhizobium]MDD1569796.1 universal stress protein [Bradyrhizobium sp. WBOS1]UUO35732.1 universal stress protein [Bradyrhizobium sp. WBOS01]MDD1526485.1 universal stress protein [Bradyrhizobium sp. WBOS2]MDD1575895.1 universal stress protein [Bradyrhizobium sp. WBOS7]MDD1599516.1 universal stress protein [Bradyrhizobium sp. WBOS16]